MTQYLSLRLVVDRGALRVVHAEAHARLDEHAVDLVAHDRDRRHVGDGDVVEPAHGRPAERAARRLGQVVVLGRLVVDGGDPAVRVGAERVLCGRVGVAARIRAGGLDDADVQGPAVRLAEDLVERAVVGSVQRARGAVRGHAGVAGGGVDVTRALGPGRRRVASRPGLGGHRPRDAHHRERQCEHQHKLESRLHGVILVSVQGSCGRRSCARHAAPLAVATESSGSGTLGILAQEAPISLSSLESRLLVTLRMMGHARARPPRRSRHALSLDSGCSTLK